MTAQNRTLWPLVVTTRVPSGLNAALFTDSSCWSGGESGLPDAVSQIRAVKSSLMVMTHEPPGLKAALFTAP